MANEPLTRRACLALFGASAAVGLLSACGSSGQLTKAATAAAQPAPAAPTSAPGAAPTAAGAAPTAAAGAPTPAATTAVAPTAAAAPIPTATPGVRALPIKSGQTELRVWFHWGGKTGDFAQALINQYNSSQGEQDKLHVTIETVAPDQMLTKMTAVKLAGDPPDVWHNSVAPKILQKNALADSLPADEFTYVNQNYIPGAIDQVTLAGKAWGYPTEFQAPAYIYRTSMFDEAGIKDPPKSTDDEYQYAVKLAKKDGGKTTRYGYTLWHDNYPITFHLPGLIARFGGQMYAFDGDRPTKIDVASPEAIDAVGWWKKMVDAGVTQVGQMPYADAWANGIAASTEIEVWFTLIDIRDAGKQDIYNDLSGTAVQPAPGKQPIVFAGGWHLSAVNGAKHPEDRWKFIKWMMHKPDMPFSHFIVERIGAIPSPTDYPTKIPGWSDAMIQTYAVESAKIAKGHPEIKVLGGPEIDKALSDNLQAILLGKKPLEGTLKALNPQLNQILQRTDPA